MTNSATKPPIRIVVTRPGKRGEGLARKLANRGFHPILMPLLEVTAPEDPGPMRRAAREGSQYASWIFTSAPAVEAYFAHQPASPGGSMVVFAVGEATAAALASRGHVAIVPDEQTAEGLVDVVATHLPSAARVLVPQAADARPALRDGLSQRGFRVDCVASHDKVLPAAAPGIFADLFDRQPYGWVTFTSPRIVKHFVELAGEPWSHRKGELEAASIGPVTSRALRNVGVEPTVEAGSPSDDQLVIAIDQRCRALARK